MTTIQQNNLSAGELSPNLYGRTDLQKYHSGVMRMMNAFVDYRGGANSRPGTQFIGDTHGNGFAHLARFTFSSTQTYMLVFTVNHLEFIRNPLTPGRANASNAGFIETTPGSGARYAIATPYAAGDLQLLKFSQSGDVLTITHPSYATQQLTRIADNNWVLASVPGLIGTSGAVPPQGLTLTISAAPSGSTDPGTTTYGYVVTSVDQDGQESRPSAPEYRTGINIATTQGTNSLTWASVDDAQFYNVYKAVPTTGLVGGHTVLVSPSAAYGFIGAAYGPDFTDTNIIADFSQSPPFGKNPLDNGQVIGYRITAAGSGYPPNATTATVTGVNGTTALLVPVLSPNYGGTTGAIAGFVIKAAGHDIVNGSAITVAGGGGSGFAGTVETNAASGAEPAVSCYFQQRRLYAGSNAKPLTIVGSKIGLYNNFDTSNPPIDSDAYEFTISAQEINRIEWMLSLPGGLVIMTDGAVLQLTGGSATVTNPVAVTPTSAVIVPQSAYGAADVVPITINHEVLYVQSTGGLVRDLTYNLYANVYTGTDLTLLSTHLFTGYSIVDWAYQDVPNKVIWAVRSDGNLISLTFLKEQDLYGWAQHVSFGAFAGVESVQEGPENAVYFVVNRGGQYRIERLCGRQYSGGVADAWCLDSALWVNIGSPVSTVSGLAHLEGMQVHAFVDGKPQGPFTVAGGSVTLTTPGVDVIVGLGYTVEIQQLPPEPASAPTAAGKLNRTVATTTIVKDTGPGLYFGTSFDTLKPFRLGITSTDARWVTPYQPNGLLTGEQRMIMDPVWNQQGGICVRMVDPMPVTILSFINEIAP